MLQIFRGFRAPVGHRKTARDPSPVLAAGIAGCGKRRIDTRPAGPRRRASRRKRCSGCESVRPVGLLPRPAFFSRQSGGWRGGAELGNMGGAARGEAVGMTPKDDLTLKKVLLPCAATALRQTRRLPSWRLEKNLRRREAGGASNGRRNGSGPICSGKATTESQA